MLSNKRSHCNEKAKRHREWPCSLHLEKSPSSDEDPAQPKNKEIIFLKINTSVELMKTILSAVMRSYMSSNELSTVVDEVDKVSEWDLGELDLSPHPAVRRR